ncbi:MAG: hypothetical protein JOZ41_11975, partial [Chloroflexi bacterium]|nr:hypothetical protein [Chloroflexota bacterium]
KTQRAEYSVIYTRDQNIELDVAVSETHAPQYRWLHNYRFAALALATRLVSIADRALQATPTSTGTATLTPTSTATPTRTSSPTSTPTLTPAPTPTNRPPTVVTSTPIGTAKPTAISTPTATPTITAHPVITGPPPGRASRQGPD